MSTAPSVKKLFLLDAMALIYRAHFAFIRAPRFTSKGLNTSATLGFTNTLVEVLQKEKPTHVVVAFDLPTPTWRHQAFKAYKAHRQAQPEDVTVAIPYVKEVVRAFNIPLLEKEGYEADDVIGTLTQQAVKEGFEVYIMTPDKDFGQLIQDHVYLYKPPSMGKGATILDTQAILSQWNISHPDQIRDILGLQGDASDNIPGIPGVGTKTAQKLIQEYGTIENLIQHADSLQGKLRQNVVQYAEQGLLSKQLATIHTDVPLDFDLEQSAYNGTNREKLRDLFQMLEFRSLATRVLNVPSSSSLSTQANIFEKQAPNSPPTSSPLCLASPPPSPNVSLVDKVPLQYHLITTTEALSHLLGLLQQQSRVSFAVKTSSLVDPYRTSLLGIAFSYRPQEAYYVEMTPEAICSILAPLFHNPYIVKIGQDLKYDLLVLKQYSLEVQGPFFDTMLAHSLLAPDSNHHLLSLSEAYLCYTLKRPSTLINPKTSLRLLPYSTHTAEAKEWACEEADITLRIQACMEPELAKNGMKKLFYEVEMPLLSVLADMEYAGVRIDMEVIRGMAAELEKDSGTLEHDILTLAGEKFNIASPKQLGVVLFEKLKLVEKPKKTKSGQYATSEAILAEVGAKHPIINKILTYRALQKLKTTYIDAFPALINPRDGRIHTSFNQGIVATGRLSSTNPNLQNIPIRTNRGKEIRRAFVARNKDYRILSADYSQIELRLLAAFSQDPGLIAAFKSNKDIHAATASKLFDVPIDQVDIEMRRTAKTVNFGIVYGISAFGLAQRLGIPRAQASQIIEAYFQEFAGVKAYMDRMIQQAKEQGYITTLLGRRRMLPDIHSRNATVRGFAERNAINTPIQGSQAELIKIAMIRIHHWMNQQALQAQMILQVHDELVFDAPLEEVNLLKEHVVALMENAFSLDNVPIQASIGIGQNWLEAH